jgi:hypothetical protein
VKRFAQDDGFVGGLEIQLIGYPENKKDRKVTGSQDDDFVGVLTKNIPNKFARLWDAVLGTPIQLTEFRRDG